MDNDEFVYTVSCFTPGCAWERAYATRAEARLAGREHEETHDYHITAVFPREEPRLAA